MRFDAAPGAGAAANTSYSLTLVCDADIEFGEYTEEGSVTTVATGSTTSETKEVKSVRTATVSFTTAELGKTFNDSVTAGTGTATGGTP